NKIVDKLKSCFLSYLHTKCIAKLTLKDIMAKDIYYSCNLDYNNKQNEAENNIFKLANCYYQKVKPNLNYYNNNINIDAASETNIKKRKLNKGIELIYSSTMNLGYKVTPTENFKTGKDELKHY